MEADDPQFTTELAVVFNFSITTTLVLLRQEWHLKISTSLVGMNRYHGCTFCLIEIKKTIHKKLLQLNVQYEIFNIIRMRFRSHVVRPLHFFFVLRPFKVYLYMRNQS